MTPRQAFTKLIDGLEEGPQAWEEEIRLVGRALGMTHETIETLLEEDE